MLDDTIFSSPYPKEHAFKKRKLIYGCCLQNGGPLMNFSSKHSVKLGDLSKRPQLSGLL